jgi:hypothetical protein
MNATPLESLERLAAEDITEPSTNGTAPKTSNTPKGKPRDKADEAWARAALENEITEVRATQAGSQKRNIQLNASSFALGQLVPHCLDRWEVERELEDAARAIGLDAREIKATIRSGIEAGMREPRYRPEDSSYRRQSAHAQQESHAGQPMRPEAEQTDQEQAEAGRATQYGAEILDAAPSTISKPLALVDGHAYAATWLHMQITEPGATKEHKSKNEKSEEAPKPAAAKVYKTMRLAVVRDDGRLYADGTRFSLSTLEVDVHLPEQPPNDKLWSAPGVRAYTGVGKYRPAPADVFDRLVRCLDRFIDFDRSLADQQTMCELIACYILATWCSDAFNVAGNIWPNGERGSGKTQLITVVADLSYLGQVILAGGSYASLRDLADYGAFLAFDDAENLSNPKTSDPDKRALLLAGNRRGNTVPVKEPDGVRGWRTRYVNTYCFRGFTAIRLPDPVLASRTIVVPLIRTNDRGKANADPLDYKLWPCDRRQLLDDLWALSLTHLHELPDYDDFVSRHARLSGRNLEPWRALLSVAAWLNEKGVKGLWSRMEDLSVKYQDERPNVETGDVTTLLVRALAQVARGVISDSCAISDITYESTRLTVKTADLTKIVHDLAEADEVDMNLEAITSRVIGRAMGRLRFKSTRENGRGTRMWEFTVGEVKRWGERYSLNLDPIEAK